MEPNISYEIKAEAFRLMTGYMAPGKDVAAGAYGASLEERAEEWSEWLVHNQEIINAFIRAIDHVGLDEHGVQMKELYLARIRELQELLGRN